MMRLPRRGVKGNPALSSENICRKIHKLETGDRGARVYKTSVTQFVFLFGGTQAQNHSGIGCRPDVAGIRTRQRHAARDSTVIHRYFDPAVQILA